MSGLMKLGGGRKATTQTLLSRLLDCHERIRRFLAIAERLAEDNDAPTEDRQLAARSLIRYFSHALPLHIADEEESLVPRLEKLGDAAPSALALMTSEHHAMQPVLDTLLPAWQRIADDAAGTAMLRKDTLPSVHALRDHMLPHLLAEERDVFPRFAALDTATEAAIVAEMEARRVGA